MKHSLLSPGEDRRIYDMAALGLPEIPMFGIHNRTEAREGLSPNIHEGLMEICYLVKGELLFKVGDRDYSMKGNTVFWTGADEIHGSGQHPYGRGLLYWLNIRLPTNGQSFLALSKKDSKVLASSLRELPRRLFHGQREMKMLFEGVFRNCENRPDPLARLLLAADLVKWLLLIVRSAGEEEGGPVSADILSVLEMIESNPGAPLGVADLARTADLSESRFKTKFREQVGVPPGEYVLRRKVALAEEMLAREKESVTGIAHELGFSSSQYFATVFKRYTNKRPSDLLSE